MLSVHTGVTGKGCVCTCTGSKNSFVSPDTTLSPTTEVATEVIEEVEVTRLASEDGASDDRAELQALMDSMRRLRVVVLVINMICILMVVALFSAFAVIFHRFREIRKERARQADQKRELRKRRGQSRV